MWQSIIALLIVGIALFFIGRKLFRTIKQAVDPKQNVSCGCGCSGCGVSDCSSNKD